LAAAPVGLVGPVWFDEAEVGVLVELFDVAGLVADEAGELEVPDDAVLGSVVGVGLEAVLLGSV